MKYIFSLFAVLLTYSAGAQSWTTQVPFTSANLQVESISVIDDVQFSVTTIDRDGANRTKIDFDPTTGNVIATTALSSLCGREEDRVSTNEFILTESAATGFTLNRVTYDVNCNPTVLQSYYYDLGNVGDTVRMGEGLYDAQRDRYYAYGVEIHDVLSADDVPYQQFVYEIDPNSGDVTQSFIQPVLEVGSPPQPQFVIGIDSELGLLTSFYDSWKGIIQTTPLNGTAEFKPLAYTECGNKFREGTVVFNREVIYYLGDCGGRPIYAIVQNEIHLIEGPHLADSIGVVRLSSSFTTAPNGDFLATGMVGNCNRCNLLPTGSYAFRTRGDFNTGLSDGVSIQYYAESGPIVPDFSHIAPVDTAGFFAAGEAEGELFVVKVQNQISGLFEQSSTIEVEVFPNPSQDFVQIGSAVELMINEPFAIYNQAGALVRIGTLSGDARIEVQELTSGIYTLILPRLKGAAQITVQ